MPIPLDPLEPPYLPPRELNPPTTAPVAIAVLEYVLLVPELDFCLLVGFEPIVERKLLLFGAFVM